MADKPDETTDGLELDDLTMRARDLSKNDTDELRGGFGPHASQMTAADITDAFKSQKTR